MMIEVLKSKIHCARVTEANLNYMGRDPVYDKYKNRRCKSHSGTDQRIVCGGM